LALLAVVILLNVLFRYPRSEHEIDVDSFFIHALSGAIVLADHASWAINPLSYFGLYPLSYPSAGPFLLASISDVSALNVETCVLVMTLLLGPVGILAAFIMAREILSDNRYALAVALFYGLAPRFLAITLWTASTRNLFMAVLPILPWALLRIYRRRALSHEIVLVITSATLAATHRLVVLLSIVIAAFLFGVLAQLAMKVIRIRFPNTVLRNSVRKATPHLALTFVVISALVMLFGTSVPGEYSVGEFASGSSLTVEMLNLAISIARSAGLALPLSLAGLVVMTRQRNKTIAQPFLAMALLSLIPTLFLRQYTGFYIMPFLALFAGFGFFGILGRLGRHRRAAAAAGIVMLVCIAATSAAILEIEVTKLPVLPSDEYTLGVYVRAIGYPGTMIANDGITGIHVGAVSGAKLLPIGGAGTTFQNPELLAYGFYSGDEVNARLVRVPLQSLTIDSDSFWVVDIQAELDWVGILQSPYGTISDSLQSRYQPAFFLELNAASGNFVAFGHVYCSNLALTAHEKAFAVYENGVETIWWLNAPDLHQQPGSAPGPCH
jgi:hypothetical protein